MKFKKENFDTMLNEAYDHFQARGISILSTGFSEVLGNGTLFENYSEFLLEGLSADANEVVSAIMENTRSQILKESSLTSIAPIASLSMPVIRKLWPKFALKDAIKTEVATSPAFTITYMKPYLRKGNDKIYLPNGLMGTAANNFRNANKTYMTSDITALANGAATTIVFDTTVSNTPSAIATQPLDELSIVEIAPYALTADVALAAGKTYYTLGTGKFTAVKAADLDVADIGDYYEKGASVAINGRKLNVTGQGSYPVGNGQLIVQFEGKDRRVTLAFVNGTGSIGVVVKAGVSSEYNEDQYSLEFEYARQDIRIPSGMHLTSSLPIETLQDTMALYQIDHTKEVIDTLTHTFSMQLDLEILDFLDDSLANRPNNYEFADYGTISDFVKTFDCRPAAGFAGSPGAWREELKRLIDFLAIQVKNETKFTSGIFTIVGNPLDINLITNVDWAFRGGNGSSVEGVEVDYSVGTFVGANTYKVISSQNVAAGMIYIVFTPTTDSQMTYKYYPYTFSTELGTGYVDANRSRTPSVMMTKRHALHEFQPAIAGIAIENNGNPFNAYVSTKEVV